MESCSVQFTGLKCESWWGADPPKPLNSRSSTTTLEGSGKCNVNCGHRLRWKYSRAPTVSPDNDTSFCQVLATCDSSVHNCRVQQVTAVATNTPQDSTIELNYQFLGSHLDLGRNSSLHLPKPDIQNHRLPIEAPLLRMCRKALRRSLHLSWPDFLEQQGLPPPKLPP